MISEKLTDVQCQYYKHLLNSPSNQMVSLINTEHTNDIVAFIGTYILLCGLQNRDSDSLIIVKTYDEMFLTIQALFSLCEQYGYERSYTPVNPLIKEETNIFRFGNGSRIYVSINEGLIEKQDFDLIFSGKILSPEMLIKIEQRLWMTKFVNVVGMFETPIKF